MRAFLLLTAVLPLVGLVRGQAQVPEGMTTLAALRDCCRPLLIFAPKPDSPELEIQVRTLNEHAAEAADRQLVAVALPYANPSPTPVHFTQAESEALRRKLGIAPAEFAVVLIGKDGGEKLRTTHPLSMRQLNATIDAMPMRKQEMQRGR